MSFDASYISLDFVTQISTLFVVERTETLTHMSIVLNGSRKQTPVDYTLLITSEGELYAVDKIERFTL